MPSGRPVVLLGVLVAGGLAAAAGCGGPGPGTAGDTPQENRMQQRPIDVVLAEVTPRWMAVPGVVTTYQSALEDGTPCIKVGVDGVTPEIRAAIPEEVEGYRVILVDTGPIVPRH